MTPWTADTITDDEIRELARSQSPVTGNCAYLCAIAIGDCVHPDVSRSEARARCAKILNRRHGRLP